MDDAAVRQALGQIARAPDADALETLRVRLLGRKSELTRALRGLGALPAQERRTAGEGLNAAKGAIEQALSAREAAVRASAVDAALERERADVTLPGRPVRVGRHHPLIATMREVVRIFAGMGFETVEGPEVEWDYYAFEVLNIPKGHPARDKFSSLWISNPLGDLPDRPMLLRPHTSPMQARVMEKRQPPIRVIVPGRVFRYEALTPIQPA